MSYIWAIVAFVLGVLEFVSASPRPEWIFGWFVVSALFTIAANVAYGGRRNNG